METEVRIMGILNATPDSYYAPSRAMTVCEAERRVGAMIEEGASYIDVGACSTRPGAELVDEKEEWERLRAVLPSVRRLAPEGVGISIDTFRWSIVERALDLIGEVTVNDISAGEDDPLMLRNVGESSLEYIAMHKRGIPSMMQSLCDYRDVTESVMEYFREFEQRAMTYGIPNWILDPGFGFAKTPEQCRKLLDDLSRFRVFGRPILVGISRKSMIYKPMGLTPDSPEVLERTKELHRAAVLSGATILRAHDVKAAVEASRI